MHKPVLEREVLELMEPTDGRIYLDGTLGLGGHASAILQISAPGGRLIGVEWDNQALEKAIRRLAPFHDRTILTRGSYADLIKILADLEVEAVDGILVDLGVSSLQLDAGDRGFSFRYEAPLDMRMDRRKDVTAADLVNRLSREELADIFYRYGEERQSRRIADRVVTEREREPLETTKQLADIVAAAIPKKYHPQKIHVATKVFQALRIAVNREFDNLTQLLHDAPAVLKPGGRICIITFHSIEDRIVKQHLQANPSYRVLTKRPVEPSRQEIEDNPRARSARLRAAVKTEH